MQWFYRARDTFPLNHNTEVNGKWIKPSSSLAWLCAIKASVVCILITTRWWAKVLHGLNSKYKTSWVIKPLLISYANKSTHKNKVDYTAPVYLLICVKWAPIWDALMGDNSYINLYLSRKHIFNNSSGGLATPVAHPPVRFQNDTMYNLKRSRRLETSRNINTLSSDEREDVLVKMIILHQGHGIYVLSISSLFQNSYHHLLVEGTP